MKNTLMLATVFCAGVLFGMFFRLPSVKAQGRQKIYADKVETNGAVGTIATGSQVVGFSCVAVAGGSPQCFVATQ